MEFEYTFRVGKRLGFEVSYITLMGNRYPYFSTSAFKLTTKRDEYARGGQAQHALLEVNTKAREFWEYWDKFHLRELTDEQLLELERDINELKMQYPYIEGSKFSDFVELDIKYSK